MTSNTLSVWVASSFLLSLRVGPVFLFAPPFTLTRVPRLVIALFSLGLAGMLVTGISESARVSDLSAGYLFMAAVREFTLGLIPVLALQVMFGALYVAGRTIDIQSGYGLALLIDPTTRGQTPLVGTIFAYLAGATFFAMDGHLGLLRFFAASLDAIPLGTPHGIVSLEAVTSYLFVTFVTAFGVAGGVILILFLTDIVIALLSRTVPQMNALVLGIQVKSMLLLIVLPIVLGISGAVVARMVGAALQVMPRLI